MICDLHRDGDGCERVLFAESTNPSGFARPLLTFGIQF
jgi:hypothetical protein